MANATATAIYALTAAGDLPTKATALAGEAGIDSATVDLTTVATPDNVMDITVVADSASDAVTAAGLITAAATAVGGVILKTQTGLDCPNGIKLTCDAPTLVADDDTPTQEEGAATVNVTLTCVNKYGAVATITTKDLGAAGAFSVLTDNGDNTATLAIDSLTGDAGVYTTTFTATDGIGQTVDEVVTITITAP